MRRKEPLETGQIYHIFNRSIASYTIFNSDQEYGRMMLTVRHYQPASPPYKFSRSQSPNLKERSDWTLLSKQGDFAESKLVDIIAYCLMPTHFHFILRQERDGGISEFLGNIQNSYTRYFNIRHNRQGPLWQGRFKNVLVKTDDQLIHLTRYIHLNPSTGNIVQSPEMWAYSSYKEYTDPISNDLCNYQGFLDINPVDYKIFVQDRIFYQRDLAAIKHLIFE